MYPGVESEIRTCIPSPAPPGITLLVFLRTPLQTPLNRLYEYLQCFYHRFLHDFFLGYSRNILMFSAEFQRSLEEFI